MQQWVFLIITQHPNTGWTPILYPPFNTMSYNDTNIHFILSALLIMQHIPLPSCLFRCWGARGCDGLERMNFLLQHLEV